MYTDFKDYYQLLQLSFPATEEEIKKAYRKMARENHPDLHPEQAELYTRRFQEVTEAYEVLSDPYKKANYDFRYRQLVLQEYPEPQYEYYYDDTPENTNTYEHKYTAKPKSSRSYFPIGALLVIGFQLLRMVTQVTPVQSASHGEFYSDPPADIRALVDSLNREAHKDSLLHFQPQPPVNGLQTNY